MSKLIMNDITGRINQAGIISKKSLLVLSFSKNVAAAATAKTVDWLVDCGIPNKLATKSEMETEKRIIDTTIRDMNSGASNSLPMVIAVPLPARMAPKNTITPNKPGIKLLRSTFAPYAAEKAGPVPLPPIVMAKNIANTKGKSNGLNNGEIINFRFLK